MDRLQLDIWDRLQLNVQEKKSHPRGKLLQPRFPKEPPEPPRAIEPRYSGIGRLGSDGFRVGDYGGGSE